MLKKGKSLSLTMTLRKMKNEKKQEVQNIKR